MSVIDEKNMAFWNELCGTGLAAHLGITDDSASSLNRFDKWYFDIYPYLFDHIPFEKVSGSAVLEIGLGYGTVAQKLIESGADYHGLDIAAGPVAMAQHRADMLGKAVGVSQGSALAIPYPDRTFDFVVTIGCLHHTGDLALALREVQRVLKTGGQATIMVYNALSYRHWLRSPIDTYRRMTSPDLNWSNAETFVRSAYDANQAGVAAPSTTFISAAEARAYLQRYFRTIDVVPRNINSGPFIPMRLWPRSLVNACFERFVGLDLYIECIK